MKSAYVPKSLEGDCITLRYYALALSVAKPYYQGTDFDSEIRGAAIEGLAIACNKLDSGHTPEGTEKSYICNYVKGNILEVIRNRRLIPIPKMTLLRRKEDGRPTEIKVLRDISADNQFSLYLNKAVCQPELLIDTLDDYMDEIDFNERERNVLELRMKGKTVREVAQSLEIEKSMVSLIVQAMKKKWKNWLSR